MRVLNHEQAIETTQQTAWHRCFVLICNTISYLLSLTFGFCIFRRVFTYTWHRKKQWGQAGGRKRDVKVGTLALRKRLIIKFYASHLIFLKLNNIHFTELLCWYIKYKSIYQSFAMIVSWSILHENLGDGVSYRNINWVFQDLTGWFWSWLASAGLAWFRPTETKRATATENCSSQDRGRGPRRVGGNHQASKGLSSHPHPMEQSQSHAKVEVSDKGIVGK